MMKTPARPRGNTRNALKALLLAALMAASVCAQATRPVAPGKQVSLAPDEGLLVVSVDSDSELARLRFDRIGTNRDSGTFRSLKKGVTTRLFAVPAGRYRWTKVTQVDSWSFTAAIDMTRSREFEFEVKPGRINYAGDLVYRNTGFFSAHVRLANRTLPVLDWIGGQHPALADAWPFEYTGHYPDPFPAFYASVRAEHAGAGIDRDATRAPPAPATTLPLPPRELWAPAGVVDVALSPDGALVAYATRETVAGARTAGNADERIRWTLYIFDVQPGTLIRVLDADAPFIDIRWESDRTLLATTRTLAGGWLHALHVGESNNGVRPLRRVDGPVGGTVVDLLPAEPNVVLYQKREGDGIAVHRLHLDSKEAVGRFHRARLRDRLNTGVERDVSWFTDGHGRLRAAYARRNEDDLVLVHGRDGVFREVMTVDGQGGFQPSALTFDGERFIGFIEDGRGQRELVEFDPDRREVTRTIHSKPGVDLVSAVFDERRNPIGVRYYRDGQLMTDHFQSADQNMERLLRNAFPGRSVAGVGRSRDGAVSVLWVDGSDQPPQLYLLDVPGKHAQLLADVHPGLQDRAFAAAEVLKLKASDGTPLEAFFTRPPEVASPPLVVLAHGGPIGVQDDLHFNREVQFLASLGYAVLQVNFRGSDGYGTAFRKAGHRNFGRMIEDDIDTAVQAVLARGSVDGSRMCAVGTSYGGYSAMVSTIRWPSRYRCAVSIAGVSDRALFFTASDSGRDAKVRREMEKVMGDPRVPEDLASMQATSPLYRVKELQVPLMLIHGRDDARVDYEHTRRLIRLLNLEGRTPVVMSFDEEGHGLDDLDNIEAAWKGVAGFLQTHLAPGAASAGSAASR